MGNILERMRVERRITLIILAVLMGVALVYRVFFSSFVMPSEAPGAEALAPAEVDR